MGWRYAKCEACKGSGLLVEWTTDLSDFDFVPCNCDDGWVRIPLAG